MRRKRNEKLLVVEADARQPVFMFPRVDNRVKVSRYHGSPDTGLRSTNCQSNRERLRVSVAEKADHTSRLGDRKNFVIRFFLLC